MGGEVGIFEEKMSMHTLQWEGGRKKGKKGGERKIDLIIWATGYQRHIVQWHPIEGPLGADVMAHLHPAACTQWGFLFLFAQRCSQQNPCLQADEHI